MATENRPQWQIELLERNSWTRHEFLSACSGRDPESLATSPGEWDAELQWAARHVTRAIDSREFTVAFCRAATADEPDPDYFVQRDEAILWVTTKSQGRFPTFPFSMDDVASRGRLEELDTREQTSLLIIIAALAHQAKVDLTQPVKAAGIIEAAAHKLGAKISSRTIVDHLNQIPEALERKR